MKTIKLAEFLKEAEARFGGATHKWKFVCPSCKTAQSAEDMVAAGVSKEDVGRYVGFSCVGRFNKGKTGCDWTLGGLFRIHELEIEDESGKMHPHFDLAEAV
jgi:hypothetical protein